MPRRATPFLLFAGAFLAAAAVLPAGVPGSSVACAVELVIGGAAAVIPYRSGSVDGPELRAIVVGMLLAAAAVGSASTGDRSSPLSRRLEEGRLRGVVEGEVAAAPEPFRRGWGMTVEVDSVDVARTDGHSRIRLFVPPDCVEESHPPLPGARIRVFAELEPYPGRRFPGRPSRRRRMSGRGIVARGVAEDTVERVGSTGGPVDSLRRMLAAGRLAYLRFVLRDVDSPAAEYAAAMTAGARSLLSADQTGPFRRTGAAHVLAISGLHLGILAGLLWYLFGLFANLVPSLLRRWGRRRVCAVPVLTVLGLYVWGIGAPVSALRAFVMVAAVVCAVASSRPIDSLHGLAAAAVVLVATDPGRLEALGFQLSFAATGAILWFLERRPDPLRSGRRRSGESWTARWGRRIASSAAVSLSATFATWPVLWAWNGWVPFDAVWVNLIVTPIVGGLLVPVLFGGALLSGLAPALAAVLLGAGGRAVGWCAWLLEFVADRPPYGLVVGRLSPMAACLAEIGVLLVVGSRGRWRPIVTGLLVVGLSVGPAALGGGADGSLRLHFIPVGQGDATLVEFPNGETLLVDAGGRAFGSDPGRRTVAPYLRRQGIARLDRVVGTHADIDHVGGLPAVARRLRPRSFLYDPGAGPAMSRVAAELERRGTRLRPVAAMLDLEIGGTDVRIWRPGGGPTAGDNDRSLVVLLEYGGTRVLLPGDIEARTERRLLRRIRRPCAIVKVPHHGSKTSSSPPFVRRLDPEVAVVSAGRFNPFGHPHPSVERRYRRRGTTWLETARHGLVRVTVDRDGTWRVGVTRSPES